MELEDERFQSCLHPLTEQDRIRLKSLEEKEEYRELAVYMLEHGVKLEQEDHQLLRFCWRNR